ncbi:MAG: M16 family metallopeptidase [Planctomycetota bacterium]
MAVMHDEFDHRYLNCGIELGVLPIPGKPLVAMEIRLFAGYAYEDCAYLGVARVMEEAISKGTAKRDGRSLNDAFDEIGAAHVTNTGREIVRFSCLCLPEFIGRAIELHAEMIRTPTFSEDSCKVAVDLTAQALAALQDDPQDLARKYLHKQAYGDPLGRHVLGEEETLARIGRDVILDHWHGYFSGRGMQVSIAGAVDPVMAADLLEGEFDGFSGCSDGGREGVARSSFSLDFSPVRSHYDKDTEQEQIGLCFPGAGVVDDDFPVQQVIIGLLAGGMSARLFTELREKQGLVYWVSAWRDQPRQGGMIHLGASSTPQNVAKTYMTLLREIDRLSEDVSEEEIERVVAGIETRFVTRGDVTRSKAGELADDLFYHGRPCSRQEELARIKAVTVSDVRKFLEAHAHDELSVVTVGPAELCV